LDIGGIDPELTKRTEWYDPKMDKWDYGPEMISTRHRGCAAVVKDNLVFAVGGYGGDDDDDEPLRSVDVLDLSSEPLCWKPSVEMLVERDALGVGVIDDYLYAVNNVEL